MKEDNQTLTADISLQFLVPQIYTMQELITVTKNTNLKHKPFNQMTSINIY